MKKRRILFVMLIISALMAAGCSSNNGSSDTSAKVIESSGDFPVKAVALVVPWAPGGGSDISGRVVTKYATQYMGENMIVSNIEGATGKTGQLDVLNSNPDGYKLLWEHQTLHMGQITGRTDYGWEEFDPIANPVVAYSALVVRNDAPYDTINELVEYASKNPGNINFGVGELSTSHFALLDIVNETDSNIDDYNIISVGGDTNRITGLLQKTMDATNVTFSSAVPYIESGDVKLIGIMSEERIPGYEDYPTLREQGIDVINKFNYTVYAPKGLSEDIRGYLIEVFKQVAADPDFQEELISQNFTPIQLFGDELGEMTKSEYEHFNHLADKFDLVGE